ncbi:class I SAM-dependent methyltransferase [Paraburkholderia denitrificans]|uniref:Class I SAM-dependent methyltransferase n=1 Tax=Paraburkholderia denitrificans TaxID=694025 RepID=A0ABW0JB93_9BURK
MNTTQENVDQHAPDSTKPVDTYDNVEALALDGERFIPGMYQSIMLEHYHRYMLVAPLASGLRVLDIASGEGYGTANLARHAAHAIGVDISESAVLHARRTYQASNLEYRTGNAAAIPVDTHSIDLVVSFETIEHHDQHAEMMAEIKRVLKPGGVLVMSSPNKYEYSDVPGTSNPFHVKELYLDEFRALLASTFAHHALWGQRILSGSVIAPIDGQASHFGHFPAVTQITNSGAATQALRKPLYFIAVASDEALPSLDTSILESNDVLDDMIAQFETKLYWRPVDGQYSEADSTSKVIRANGVQQDIELALTELRGPVERLRYDLADRPAVIHLSSLKLIDGADVEQWRWSGNEADLATRREVLIRREAGQLAIATLGDDPGFEIELPDDLTQRIGPTWKFVVTLTATVESDSAMVMRTMDYRIALLSEELSATRRLIENELTQNKRSLRAAHNEASAMRSSFASRVSAPLRLAASAIKRVFS